MTDKGMGNDDLTGVLADLDAQEEMFYHVVHDTARRLWQLGAVEVTLAALYDVQVGITGNEVFWVTEPDRDWPGQRNSRYRPR